MVEYVYVAEIVYADHKLVSDVADLLNGWREQFGAFPILADASHPFNNAELSNSGFDIRPISFGSWKKIGIENVSKFFVFNRLRINKNLDILIDQLKRFRRNETTGNIIKKDDHGPDSLMVSMLNFRFEDEFGPDISKAAALTQQSRMLDQSSGLAMIKDKVEFSDDGLASPVTAYPGFIPEEARKKSTQKNILVF
jgi:acyl carrier protein